MPNNHAIALFMLSALALNISPGPSILYILSRCLGEGGRRAGVVSVLGLGTAAVVHAVAVALGLSTLFIYSPLAFSLLKYLGALYLVYLGVRGVLSGGALGATTAIVSGPHVSLWAVYRQGIVTDLLNPKVALFFIAFLPQFVDPSRGSPAGQILFFGLLFNVTGVPVNLLVAYAGGSLARVLARRPVWARIQTWCSSAVLVGLGLRLAVSERR
jgi:threonine/homoserine/homoserine lactone efflux protein